MKETKIITIADERDGHAEAGAAQARGKVASRSLDLGRPRRAEAGLCAPVLAQLDRNRCGDARHGFSSGGRDSGDRFASRNRVGAPGTLYSYGPL